MTEERSTGPVHRFFSGVSVATRIATAVVVVSLLSLTIATITGLGTGRDLGEDLFTDHISSMRTSGDVDVTAYLNSLESTSEALARSPQAAAAVRAFNEALDEIDADDLPDRESTLATLADEYQELYLEPLGGAGSSVDVRDVIDEENDDSVYLQSVYSIGFEPLSSAASVDDARDGSEYSEAHALVHPAYRRITERLGLSDLLIVDTRSGQILYTVEKRPDLGASVDVGPVSGSIVSALVDQVRDNPDEEVHAADFRRYIPALLTPVAGVAAPIRDDDRLVGALVLLYAPERLTDLLRADADIDDPRLAAGGDLYLIGTDGTTRSEPHGYLESPTDFLDDAEAFGQINEDERTAIELSGTTVLALQANDATIAAADDGGTKPALRRSIDGRSVYSSVEALPYEGYPLFVVAEIDTASAVEDIDDFEQQLIVGVAVFMVVLAFGAVAWATTILRPVRALSERLSLGAGRADEPLKVPDRSPIEFHRLAARFDAMAETLATQSDELAAARADRLGVMRRMLPTGIADRLAAGDSLSLDEAPDASVVVLALHGLTPDDQPGGDQRTLLDGLIAEIDGLARHHSLEPIKVIGDEYYAAIGHERPYIDHAPRAVGFVADVFDLVADRTGDVQLAAGVASGPVAVGLTGTSRLVYDVWGVTVRRADRLVRTAGVGRVLISDETASKLPDSVPIDQYEEVTGQMAWLVDLERVGEPR